MDQKEKYFWLKQRAEGKILPTVDKMLDQQLDKELGIESNTTKTRKIQKKQRKQIVYIPWRVYVPRVMHNRVIELMEELGITNRTELVRHLLQSWLQSYETSEND